MNIKVDNESIKKNLNEKIDLDQLVISYNDTADENIFNDIYNKYLSKFKYVAFKMNNEDIVQELSIVLLNAIKTFKPNTEARFNTYFWKCAKNHLGVLKAHNWAKKRATNNYLVSLNKCITSDEGSETELGSLIEDPNSDYSFNDINFFAFLEKNLFPLLSTSEEFIIRRFLDGYTPEEIGKMIQTSTQNVHAKLKRLKNKNNLRNILLQYFNINENDFITSNRRRKLTPEEIAQLINSRLNYQPGDNLLNEEVLK